MQANKQPNDKKKPILIPPKKPTADITQSTKVQGTTENLL